MNLSFPKKGDWKLVGSLADLTVERLLLSSFVFKITNCSNFFLAHCQCYIRIKKPKTNSSRNWGCLKATPLCPVLAHLLPAGSLSHLPRPLRPCLLEGYD